MAAASMDRDPLDYQMLHCGRLAKAAQYARDSGGRGGARLHEGSGVMTMKPALCLAVVGLALALVWIGTAVELGAQQPSTTVAIDGDDIGGVVTGPGGPEAGVWVIAETTELPTKFARIVVTDDQGRYVVPDLPKAKYTVWVRGYGLVDSAKVDAEPGKQLNLRA